MPKEGKTGRPESASPLKVMMCTRVSQEQKDAIEKYVHKKFGKDMDVGTWLRELALKHSGNEHLGAAARAQAAADAAGKLTDL